MQIKKILTALGVAGAFMVAQSALATGNFTTGPDSNNRNETDIDSNMRFVVENKAEVEECFDFEVETGKNTIERNTVVEDISTGDVEGQISVQHDLNNGMSVAWDNDGKMIDLNDMDLTNHLTGPDSYNKNEVNIDNNSWYKIENKANYEGNYYLDLNTGKNTIEKNTQVGDISTGDVDVAISQNVSANGSANHITLPSGQSVEIGSLANEITGPDSYNKNEIDIDSNDCVNIENRSEVRTNIDANINTGRNRIERNTVVGDVSTGSVRFDVNLASSAN